MNNLKCFTAWMFFVFAVVNMLANGVAMGQALHSGNTEVSPVGMYATYLLCSAAMWGWWKWK
jgi:hypothetical protein